LPDGELLGQKRRDTAQDRWAMTVASEIVLALWLLSFEETYLKR
jgi:hypothetical protein